ncbi:MAG: glycoside-pentoside-hexuronide (GPH):cation symporter [Christensenellales bacterium]|jgi:melibiose permease/lactose/raffinose/galactose permease
MNREKANRFYFGIGTLGRDMFYTTVSMYLMFYLTDVLNLPDSTMWWMTLVFTLLRIFDALNDPFMGMLVDNSTSRFGKFKPGIAFGAVTGGIFMLLMFTDMGFKDGAYILVFTIAYLGWDICYGINDIAYWSMLPALSLDQKEREKTGAFARICANIGMYAVVVGILPVTQALTKSLGDAKQAWFVFALGVVIMMLFTQLFTLIGVKENRGQFKKEEKTTLRDMLNCILHNDQLLYVTLSMAIFMIGYTTTASFGVYYFKYVYGDESMYSVFALVLGVAQLTALIVFPIFSKRMNRKKMYRLGTGLVVPGYLLFFFSPMNMIFIGISGLLIFIGQAFIQLLMMMFLTDTIEYGQLKLGRRNDAVTFSLQPVINKLGGAVSSGIVGVTLILTGINSAKSAEEVSSAGVMGLKMSMLILPLIMIVIGYYIWEKKYKIDEKEYARIVGELKARGDLIEN